jgi:SET domain-containing protein
LRPSQALDIVGLFAGEDIKQNEFIIDYGGYITRVDECDFEHFLNDINDSLGRSYGFTIDEKTDLDAIDTGNLMRFANHSERQVANCVTEIRTVRGSGHACLVARRPITKGEELFFDYTFN